MFGKARTRFWIEVALAEPRAIDPNDARYHLPHAQPALTEAVIRHAVQDTLNWRHLINTQPVDWDANAAASMYLRNHPVHKAAVATLLAGPDTFLVRSSCHRAIPRRSSLARSPTFTACATPVSSKRRVRPSPSTC